MVLLLLRRGAWHGSRVVVVLRLALLLALAGVLADPVLPLGQPGRDFVFVVDRSRSMPGDAMAAVDELARQVLAQRRPGDRIGMVTFARDAAVEAAPSETWAFTPPARTLDVDGTDLGRGLQKALALVSPGRRATLLLVSDGENTGADAADVARAALRAGVRIDAKVVRRAGGLDVAVEDVAAPGEVASGEPFQFSAFVRADVAGEVPVRLLRDGVVLAEGRRHLQAGRNRIAFRDRLQEPGVHAYEVEVDAVEDRVPENNRARAVVRVTGPFRVLCVTPGGRQDRLTRALTGAGVAVVVSAAGSAPLTLDALDGFGAVVLEDVPAEDLPAGAMRALAAWVRDLGGGLLMTGGGASFGPGGYHHSPVEDVLPVTMEIRQEQRKHALAMAVALDRSGSMAMAAADGTTKMELADRGTCAAIELLGRADAVAVIAVDSAPHVVLPMGPVADKPAILDRVMRIESMGGGIYVGAALHAAANELLAATQGTKHIVLFADAADSEEPGDYATFVPKLARAGVTVSVIGLGSKTDSDAALLEDIATLGKGRCFFVTDATELPRVFAQETIQVARSSLVEEPTGVSVLPDVLALGALAGTTFSDVGGYSIAYLKERGQVGLVTDDEQKAPLFAFWQSGLGRAAAFLGEVDGRLSGPLGAWSGFAGFFATTVRWLAGASANERVFAELGRRGHEGVLSVEVEAGQEALLGKLRAHVLGADGRPFEVTLVRTDDRRLEARFALAAEGVYRAGIEIEGSGEVARVAPITLPYSPEFERRLDPDAGARELGRLTGIAEGRVDPPAAELFAGDRDSRGARSLAALLAWLALGLFVLEIAVRRLALSLPRWPRRGRLRRSARDEAAASAAPAAVPATPAVAATPAPSVRPQPPPEDIGGILARSKARTDRRLER
ncbi:MAG: VWA domain-containing protein [Planctomycetota bacterium]